MKRTALRLLAVLTGIASAAPGIAADFTFDVPVRVENLPSVTTLAVQCAVYTAYPGGRIISVARSPGVTVSGGSYDATIMVEVDNRSITPSSDARAYRCSLIGEGTARTGTRYSMSPDNFVEAYQRATAHTLVTANNQVGGPIP